MTVPGTGDASGERAQLILITALAMGVILVALVLLLNSAIFTENVATRVGDQDAQTVLGTYNSMIDGTGEILDAVNRDEFPDQSSVSTAVENNVTHYANLTDSVMATESVVANVTWMSDEAGWLVVHSNDDSDWNSTETLTAHDWTLAQDVNDVRAFHMNVTRRALHETNVHDSDVDETSMKLNSFHVRVVDVNEWNVFVYENSSTGDLQVAVSGIGISGVDNVCSVDAENGSLDLTAGTLQGEECQGLNWSEGVGAPYDLKMINGNSSKGTYNVTVEDDFGTTVGSDLADPSLNEGPDTFSPYEVDAVYAVTVDVTVETIGSRFELRGVEVAPEEPP